MTQQQECIPVGCVPPASVAVSVVGGCLPRGVCLGGGCLPRGCLPRGCLSKERCTHPPIASWDTHTPLRTEWQTGVKTLPWPKLCLRAVIIHDHSTQFGFRKKILIPEVYSNWPDITALSSKHESIETIVIEDREKQFIPCQTLHIF